MRILHVANHTIPCVGGIENAVWGSARVQSLEGHKVEIATFNTCTSGKSSLPTHEMKEDILFHRFPQTKISSFYRFPISWKFIALAQKADIVHVHGFGGWLDQLLVMRPFLPGKLVVTTHGGIFHTPHRHSLKKVYLGWLNRMGKGIDMLICGSQNDYAQYPHIGKRQQVLLDGVLVESLLDLPTGKKSSNHLMFVGRLSENKQVNRILDALALLKKKHPKLKLHVVGEDWEGLQKGLETKTKQLGLEKNVTFHGKLSDAELESIYLQSDFFVSASTYEGFGMSVIEAMAAGSTPILNAIPTFKEFVGEKSQRGWIVDFSDAEAASQMIEKAIRTPAKKLSSMQKNAREYATQFDWNLVAKKQLDIYAELLHK
ncbi:MAG: glycosyltransferase family 4 protein [Candidatus Iainarchaeum archaeon]|uniref:Glycosyltransferase family 4 protein n=1 Tax=Candidatus Iainarchaeum sp. TaxID=3101447 RepID=A0A7T9DKU8_9ARCH|nr:MAG: glycosyltransferase family 4 protein [Candidatus Diapherotrites archaeon]